MVKGYLVLGGSGVPLSNGIATEPNLVTAAAAYHFARLDLDGDTLSAVVYQANGSIRDSFTITR